MPNPENIQAHKWKKGQSGNPNGTPKGKRLSTILKQYIDGQSFSDATLTAGQKLAAELIKKAESGDIRAIGEVFDRIEGKAKQEIRFKVELEGFNIDLLTDEQQKVFVKLLNIGMGEIDNDGSLTVKRSELIGSKE